VRRPRKPDAHSGEADERTVRTAALALLAGRDFARQELVQRLLRRGFPGGIVATVVEGLAGQRLLSESRFVEQFIRQHAGRGHGPVRIRVELRERGVADTDIEEGLAAAAEDWAASPARPVASASGVAGRATTASVQDRRASCSIAGFPQSRSGPRSAPRRHRIMSKMQSPTRRMSSAELRTAFLDFFKGHGHAVCLELAGAGQ